MRSLVPRILMFIESKVSPKPDILDQHRLPVSAAYFHAPARTLEWNFLDPTSGCAFRLAESSGELVEFADLRVAGPVHTVQSRQQTPLLALNRVRLELAVGLSQLRLWLMRKHTGGAAGRRSARLVALCDTRRLR